MTLVALHRVVALHLQLAGTSPTTRTSMRISTTRWQVRGVRWVRYRLPPPVLDWSSPRLHHFDRGRGGCRWRPLAARAFLSPLAGGGGVPAGTSGCRDSRDLHEALKKGRCSISPDENFLNPS